MIKNLPQGWRVEEFINIFEDDTAKKKKIPTNLYIDVGVVPIIDQGQQFIAGYTNDINALNENIPVIIFGDHTRILKYIDFNYALGADGVKVLKNIDRASNTKYLFYYLIHSNIPNTGYNRHFKYLKRLDILLPPLPQQEKIVKVLDNSSSLVEQQKQLIKKYDVFLKSKFIEMFGDPITNPMGWEVVELGKIIDVLTDYHANGSYEILKQHVELLDKKNYALMVRTTDLENNNFKDGVKYIDENAYNFLEKTKVFGDEIIMNKIGSAGNIFLMPKLNTPVSLGMNQFLIRLKKITNEVFIFHFLKTDYGQKSIDQRVRGAVTKSITKDAVREIKVFLPPLELQNKFASIVEKIEAIKEKETQKLNYLETLHVSLMDKAFKGEIV